MVNQQNKTYKVLGIMSGTSLDGIDLCLSEFKRIGKSWEYLILAAETYSYSPDWDSKLRSVESKSAVDLIELDFGYGKLIGEFANKFLSTFNQNADLIASHGHTIFHQIDKSFTYQLGNGAAICAETGMTCISDFRSLDVALGGQGAPLVPFGDEYLFPTFNACINLGGIANLSFKKNSYRLAYDICACNMVLNHFMNKYLQKAFDESGAFSQTGKMIPSLYDELNSFKYFTRKPPKSLGKEWVFEKIIPLMENSNGTLADKLYTFTKHCAHQISNTLIFNNVTKDILFTGGGCKNTFLIELLKAEGLSFELPDEKTIDYKEALIFAFLGLFRYLGHINTLKSVTGASKNSSGGNIFIP